VAAVCITRPLRLTCAAFSRAPVAPWGSVGKGRVPPGLLLMKYRERRMRGRIKGQRDTTIKEGAGETYP